MGRPNVGKSTLVNQICRSKISITSDRPQTTRRNIRAILTSDTEQIVFVDTPGIHKPRHALGDALNAAARSSTEDVDCILFLIDAAAGLGPGDKRIASELAGAAPKVFGVVNKIDSARNPIEQHAKLDALGVVDEIFPVSARTGIGIAELLEAIKGVLPPGPMWFPPDSTSDIPDDLQIAELVREKLLRRAREELPHSIAVVTEELRRDDRGGLTVDVVIFVERDSQKGMVIGKGGSILKQVGSEARPEIESILGEQVYLELRVKVRDEWQRSEDLVQRFGYGE